MSNKVVPNSPLPEGARVEIQMRPEFTPEEEKEFGAWQQGSAEALALVERLAEEELGNEKR